MAELAPSERLVESHHQPRRAIDARAHRLIAQHRIADIDRRAARSANAKDFILDDRGFADASLRLGLSSAKIASDADGKRRKNEVTKVHFPPYNLRCLS